MRRDLKRGCATCRLRFSEQFKICPVCQDNATLVPDATSQIQPTSRAAWIAKWVIVLSSIPAIGAVACAGMSLLLDGWPPKNALDIIIYVLGSLGICLGASIAVAIPFAIWFGVVSAFRSVLKSLVDRPQRTLRVTIERGLRAPRTPRHFMHRLWDKLASFVKRQIEAPTRIILLGITAFVGAQILAEIFGRQRTIKTTSFNEFGESVIILAFIDFMSVAMFGFFVGVFGTFASIVKDFLAKPPHLFGFSLQPPPLQNETCLESFIRGRHEIIGHAAKLDEVERTALDLHNESELHEPLSGQTCLTFRLMGQAHEQPVDDADASAFVVVTKDAKRCVVTTSDVVVAFTAETKVQAPNAHGFLKERGLPERNLSLREGLLREGDLVRVVGRRTEIRVGTAGYRGNERRLMLDAGDGLPVVILPPNEPTS
jgi:hypothetical protein